MNPKHNPYTCAGCLAIKRTDPGAWLKLVAWLMPDSTEPQESGG